MTCESFNNIIHELSSGLPLDGRIESDARAHVETCESCALALDSQTRVGSLLGRVAAADRELDPPASIEATVLGAFRLAHGTANVVPLRPVATVPIVARRRYSTRWMAAAAAIVIGVAATFLTWQAMRSTPILVPTDAAGGIAKTATPGPPAPRTTLPPPIAKKPVNPEYVGPGPGRGGGRVPIIPVSATNGSRRPVRLEPTRPAAEPDELVTDFYSLVPASGFAPTEGGQLVRLEVPRASLASLGVPIPMGNPNGSVTADLVMGYDGVAHAIRFVQPNMTGERRIR